MAHCLAGRGAEAPVSRKGSLILQGGRSGVGRGEALTRRGQSPPALGSGPQFPLLPEGGAGPGVWLCPGSIR